MRKREWKGRKWRTLRIVSDVSRTLHVPMDNILTKGMWSAKARCKACCFTFDSLLPQGYDIETIRDCPRCSKKAVYLPKYQFKLNDDKENS